MEIDGELHPRFGDEPLFLTVTKTRGEHSHTDVSFWFVLAADQDMRIEVDPREAHQARWFALDDPAEGATDRFDPHMARFRDKLLARLDTPALGRLAGHHERPFVVARSARNPMVVSKALLAP
jgi:8-oxo-dGTP diphosphatase